MQSPLHWRSARRHADEVDEHRNVTHLDATMLGAVTKAASGMPAAGIMHAQTSQCNLLLAPLVSHLSLEVC